MQRQVVFSVGKLRIFSILVSVSKVSDWRCFLFVIARLWLLFVFFSVMSISVCNVNPLHYVQITIGSFSIFFIFASFNLVLGKMLGVYMYFNKFVYLFSVRSPYGLIDHNRVQTNDRLLVLPYT